MAGQNGSAMCTFEIDTSQVQSMFERMDGKVMKPAWKATFRKAIAEIAKEVKKEVRKLYPGGKRKNSGMLRGIHYGALYKDVKTVVYKNGKGANASLFSKRNKSTRWCVLYWLNEGADRTGEHAAYTRTATKKPSDRGILEAKRFFKSAVQVAEPRAMQILRESLPNDVAKAANKELNK